MKKLNLNFMDYSTKTKIIIIAVVGLLLLIVPFCGFSNYVIRVFAMVFIYSILTLSLNVITGYLGATSMGHAAFYAVGAYTGAILATKLGVGFWPSLIFSIIMGALMGLFLGVCTMRLSGSYMTVTTLAFLQVITLVGKNWTSLTNGTLGIKGIPKIKTFGITMTLKNGGYYYIALFLLVVCILFMYLLVNSKYGRAFIAVRDDELSARMMGLDTKKTKIMGCAISGALAGLAGCYYSFLIGYIDPVSFSFDISMTILTMAILGGLASISGSIFGAVILTVFPEMLRSLNTYRFFFFGFILVLMMRVRARGIMGGVQSTLYHLPKGVSAIVRGTRKEDEIAFMGGKK